MERFEKLHDDFDYDEMKEVNIKNPKTIVLYWIIIMKDVFHFSLFTAKY